MPLPPGYERLEAIRREREKVEPMFESIVLPIILPILARYAVAMAGSAATAAATYAMAHWGLSTGAVSVAGGGAIVGIGAVVAAVAKNKNAAAIIARIPVTDMLHAVATSTKARVTEIQVADAALADAVPSPKVVPVDPAGHSQPQV